jgi:hypothetical protein
LGLLSVFGNLGRHQNVASSCGWWHIRGAGQRIGWPSADSLTLTSVPYVIKRRKISNISWLAVFAREFWFQLLQFVGLAALTPQPSVPYVIKRRKISNISWLAVFAREFWFQLLQFVGLAALTPQPSDSFADW